MAKLILIGDDDSAYIYPDAEVTIDWESDIVDGPDRWMTRPRFPRPNSGKTVVAASTHCPMVHLPADASEAERLAAFGFGDDMKLVRQGSRIDPDDVRKGDRIRIEWTYGDGTTLAREETVRRNGHTSYPYQSGIERRVYLLERAPFKLPTTPGAVVRVETDEDCDGAADYVLDLGGVWRGGENGSAFNAEHFEDHFDGDPQILVAGDES